MRFHFLFRAEKLAPKSSATWRREGPLANIMHTASPRNPPALPMPGIPLLCCTLC